MVVVVICHQAGSGDAGRLEVGFCAGEGQTPGRGERVLCVWAGGGFVSYCTLYETLSFCSYLLYQPDTEVVAAACPGNHRSVSSETRGFLLGMALERALASSREMFPPVDRYPWQRFTTVLFFSCVR